MDRFKKNFRENLQHFRKKAGYTQVKLSEASGFEASYVGKLERGEADPSLESIRQIKEALGVSPEDLLLTSEDVSSGEEHDLEDKLKVHEVELEMQKEELNRTEEELRQSRDRYYSWFQEAPVALVTVKEDGIILEANRRFRDLFVAEKTDVEGEHVNGFVHPEDRDDFYSYRMNIARETDPEPVVLRFGERRGIIRSCKVESSLVEPDDETKQFLVSLQDVSRWVDEPEATAE